MEVKSGVQHTERIDVYGRKQAVETRKQDGTQETKHFDPHGRVNQVVVVSHDGAKQATHFQYDRGGKERARETVILDGRNRPVSKTIVVHPTVIVGHHGGHNTVIIEKHYDHGRYGFVYRPAFAVHTPLVLFSNPYWYGPPGVVITPFRFTWGWSGSPWYAHHGHYWAVYDVYPEPSYWVTDYVIAGYVADRYEATPSLQQAQQDLNAAREDLNKATAVIKQNDELIMKMAAQRAPNSPEDEVLIQTQAELAEAKTARQDAENRAKSAETQLAWAKSAEGKFKEPNPNATPIDQQTKDDLRNQIAAEMAEQREAQKAGAGATAIASAPVSDLSKSLADPKHIYPVSTSIPVVLAADGRPAGNITEGDLLRLEPGQEKELKEATENNMVAVRVMSSKGEPGEVTAGTVISIPLKTLQDFDNELRAKLDQGLLAANDNQGQFKKVNQ